jgi:hypothetical protein
MLMAGASQRNVFNQKKRTVALISAISPKNSNRMRRFASNKSIPVTSFRNSRGISSSQVGLQAAPLRITSRSTQQRTTRPRAFVASVPPHASLRTDASKLLQSARKGESASTPLSLYPKESSLNSLNFSADTAESALTHKETSEADRILDAAVSRALPSPRANKLPPLAARSSTSSLLGASGASNLVRSPVAYSDLGNVQVRLDVPSQDSLKQMQPEAVALSQTRGNHEVNASQTRGNHEVNNAAQTRGNHEVKDRHLEIPHIPEGRCAAKQ